MKTDLLTDYPSVEIEGLGTGAMDDKNRPKKSKGGKQSARAKREADYRHLEVESPLRPDVGIQAQFRERNPPVTYRYDSSLAPALDWDGQNSAREQGKAAIKEIVELDTAPMDRAACAEDAKRAVRAAIARAKAAADKLKRLGNPYGECPAKAEAGHA